MIKNKPVRFCFFVYVKISRGESTGLLIGFNICKYLAKKTNWKVYRLTVPSHIVVITSHSYHHSPTS